MNRLEDLDRLVRLGWGEWPVGRIPLLVRCGLSDQKPPTAQPPNVTLLTTRVQVLESRVGELAVLSRRVEEHMAILGALEERLSVLRPPAGGEAR